MKNKIVILVVLIMFILIGLVFAQYYIFKCRLPFLKTLLKCPSYIQQQPTGTVNNSSENLPKYQKITLPKVLYNLAGSIQEIGTNFIVLDAAIPRKLDGDVVYNQRLHLSSFPVLATPSAFCSSGYSYIRLSWTPSDNVSYYVLWRNDGATLTPLYSIETFRDDQVQSNLNYTYFVEAVGIGGSSLPSNSQTITSISCAAPSASVLSNPSPGLRYWKPIY